MKLSKFASVRHKIVLVYLVVILEIFTIIIFTRYFWTIPQFIQLERIADQKDIERVNNIIASKINELALVNYDNAVWNDSYEFVVDKNEEFASENFVIDTFISLDLNGVYYYDLAGELVWGESYNRADWQPLPAPLFDQPPSWFIQNILVQLDEVIKSKNRPVTHKGIIFIDNKPVMFAATSIMPGNAVGDPRGTLLFYRYILPQNEQAFATQATTDITMIWPNNTQYDHYLTSLARGKNLVSRDKSNELTLINYDYLNNTPYFIKIKAGARAFDNVLLDDSIMIALIFSLLGILYLYHFVSQRFIRPIFSWNDKISAIVNNKDYSIRFTEKGNDELTQFSQSFNQLMAFVEQQNNKIKEHNQKLIILSNTDGLTKIYNRRYFDNAIHQLWQTLEPHHNVCLCMIDIDYFKNYNDHYGHQMGDNALIKVAQTLMENTKRSSDIVARYGGEEFIIILNETSAENGKLVAENLCRSIHNLNIVHQQAPLGCVTISAGIASCIPSVDNSPRSLLHMADEALYQAKNAGKNQVGVFNKTNSD